jgi:deoxyribodipyrimidine photo-lyase type I
LKYGTVGIRTVYAATQEARARAPDESAREAVDAFQSQLAWREFYTQVLFYHPHVVSEDYRTYEHPIPWRDDPDALTAWKLGRRGTRSWMLGCVSCARRRTCTTVSG